MRLNAAAAVAASLFASFCFAGVRGNGVIRQETRSVGAFDAVQVCCGIDGKVSIGPKVSVVLEGDENLLSKVRTEVKGGRLVVDVEPSSNLVPTRAIRVTVVTPKLRGVQTSGGSSLVAKASEGPEFEAEASGGAELTVSGIRTRRLTLSASGGAEVALTGTADELVADASGGVTLKAGGLAAKRVEIDASGGVDGVVFASAEVTGSASGGVSLAVKGNPPKSRVSTSGGASVDYDD